MAIIEEGFGNDINLSTGTGQLDKQFPVLTGRSALIRVTADGADRLRAKHGIGVAIAVDECAHREWTTGWPVGIVETGLAAGQAALERVVIATHSGEIRISQERGGEA